MKDPLVIAHVLSSFGLGGQESVAVELARLQKSDGHTVLAVSIASQSEGPCAELFREAGVSTATVAKGPRVDPSLPVRLAMHLKKQHVAVVHTHNPHALIYGAPAAHLAGAVAIHSKHGMNPDRPRRLWLRRNAARFVDAYVAVTPTLKNAALASGDCEPSRLHVISNGIDVNRFVPNPAARREVRTELGIPDDAWVVCTVGRLAEEKNQSALLDAMAPLLDERRRLLLVGDGPARAALRKQVDGMDGGRYVRMTGARPDVERVLAASDAFALTSRTEGLPLVLLEAMATGLPVVTSAVGGIPDVVEHRATGLLYEAGTLAPLRRQLEWLSIDAPLSRQLGRAARHHVATKYSVERMATEYEALYADVLWQRVRRAVREAMAA
jgi:glycosyltransferase involved in cell wall biosynthesis